jgi:hypothetical protein
MVGLEASAPLGQIQPADPVTKVNGLNNLTEINPVTESVLSYVLHNTGNGQNEKKTKNINPKNQKHLMSYVTAFSK